MSIRDEDGNDIIQMNWIWSASFKLLLVSVPFVAITLFTWGTWVTVTIFEHSAQIRVLQDRASRPSGGNIQGASINVGKADSTEATASATGRNYLTVKEVAEREKKDERTITLWIEQGRIHPAPAKAGKAWTITADYRILPHYADDSRNIPQPTP